jgi:hypothetical protein
MIPSVAVRALGRRFHVEWDPLAPVTPLGQLVFFCQSLATSGLYSKRVATCPRRYRSPNAPSVREVLGISVLAILSGAFRYAHVTALRGDQVNPPGLGMEKVVSEDSLRLAFQDEDSAALAQWQTQALLVTYAPALEQPWIGRLGCDNQAHLRASGRSGSAVTIRTSPDALAMLITPFFCAPCARPWMGSATGKATRGAAWSGQILAALGSADPIATSVADLWRRQSRQRTGHEPVRSKVAELPLPAARHQGS